MALSPKPQPGVISRNRLPESFNDNELQWPPTEVPGSDEVLQVLAELYYNDGYVELKQERNKPSPPDIEYPEEEILQTLAADDELSAPADPEKVGALFARAREGKCITRSDLERNNKIARSNLSAFERGVKSPTLDRVQRYADAIGYDVRIQFIPKS